MKLKVIFIIPSLRPGGAERVMSFLANNLNSQFISTKLVIIEKEENKAYEVNNTSIIFLNKKSVKSSVFKIIYLLHKEKPQVVISAIGHVNAALAIISILFPKITFIGRETIVSKKSKKINTLSKIFSYLLHGMKSKFLDIIICQSNDMKNALERDYNYPSKKLVIINNPITKKFNLKKEFSCKRTIPKMITVGRLTKQKGYARILLALSKLKIPFKYTIIGQGPEYDMIMNLIKTYNLADSVEYIPFTNKVEHYLSISDLYLQGSFVEGFPNALIETCAVGTPAIAYKAPGGIDEIIKNNINGFIAEDDEDFLAKIILGLKKEWNPVEIRESVFSKYSEEKIIKKYQKLLLSI